VAARSAAGDLSANVNSREMAGRCMALSAWRPTEARAALSGTEPFPAIMSISSLWRAMLSPGDVRAAAPDAACRLGLSKGRTTRRAAEDHWLPQERCRGTGG
jgi:hypothetical protein